MTLRAPSNWSILEAKEMNETTYTPVLPWSLHPVHSQIELETRQCLHPVVITAQFHCSWMAAR